MRIIAGDYKCRRLETPIGAYVRPTSDKVKEAIFNILMYDIEDGVCVDLFSGTGNLGLEALSRGAKKCYFCDNSKESIKLTKTNILKCGAEKKSVIITADYTKALSKIEEKVDVFFLDPPYEKGLYETCFKLINTFDLIKEDGVIIAEHSVKNPLEDRYSNLVKVKEKKYGTIMLSIYRVTSGEMI